MLRVPVRPSEFLVGKPIPFDVFDRHGRLLLAKGHVIASAEEKEKLLRQGAERNLTTDERFRQAADKAVELLETPHLVEMGQAKRRKLLEEKVDINGYFMREMERLAKAGRKSK